MENPLEYPLLSMEYKSLDHFILLFWKGNLENTKMLLRTVRPYDELDPISFHRYKYHINSFFDFLISYCCLSFLLMVAFNFSSAMVLNKAWTEMYCCPLPGLYTVCKFTAPDEAENWGLVAELRSPCKTL